MPTRGRSSGVAWAWSAAALALLAVLIRAVVRHA
jgi:hypothetical protein